MLFAFRFCLLLLSFSGYALFVTQKYQIRVEFAPALFCAWCSVVLFAAGLINCLPAAVFLLFVGGFALLALAARKKYFFTKQDALKYAGFLALLIYFFILMQGTHYVSYDNFSHWATVVKDMLNVDRMPNFEDSLIRFQSYPLGSSLFIYYICKVIGASDACLLWGQLLMLLSFLFCVYAFAQKKNLYTALAALLYGIWALTANNHIYELRVDTLLPVVGVGAFAYIFYYKKESEKAILGSAAMFVLLIQIKNSDIFFYAVCVICLAAGAWDYCKKHGAYFFSFSLLMPLGSMYLWKRHVAFSFSAGMDSKHSMNLAHFQQVAAKKSAEEMRSIGIHILKQFTSFKKLGTTPGAGMQTNKGLVLLVLLLMFFMAMCLLSLLLRSRQALYAVLCAGALNVGCFIVYTISVYAMYLFSMPPAEASRLASFDRYMFSIYIFMYGLTVIFALYGVRALQSSQSAASFTVAIVACLLFVLPLNFCNRQLPTLVEKPAFADSKRNQLWRILEQAGIEKGASCAVYSNTTDTDKRYFYYLTRYELWSPKILSVNRNDFLENKKKLKKYDYLIVWDSDELIDGYLRERGLSQYAGRSGICVKLGSG